MKIHLYIKGRQYDYRAEGIYDDGSMVVKKGSTINIHSDAKSNLGADVENMRENKELVANDGSLIKDCKFVSPSAAAKFVTGGSRNGYDTWKNEEGKTLGEILEEKGIRQRRKNKGDKSNGNA